MKRKTVIARPPSSMYERIRKILDSARSNVARSVNTTQVIANWLIGREIVEEEQKGKRRAEYGEGLICGLAILLQADYGVGYSLANVKFFRKFYLEYPRLCSEAKGYAARSLSWQPGLLHPTLSWTHYRTLLRVGNNNARSFYEIEAIKNNWSARELERQINSLLYERLALSKDKKGLMRLATRGQVVQKPVDVFKDPMVMEFLGLPESPKLVETDLEQALINDLQSFLLELGKGFAFVARQERLTLDGDHFHIDLRERRTEGDNPTLRLILCADKNDAVVRYTLGKDQRKKIFAGRYKLHLPSEAELRAELRREVRMLSAPTTMGKAK